ncbi:predicted protein [Naegleria gruberi]|uniref:Predicted protein n=1 Tax=Naegleria gruberi TaxID=5762 RepID=D2VQX1_NAEGR|nr:uncharacterized protein NAEGRDRAFT_71376 [Naegleria gruberi]EFC40709.1 predicted protein [Naegleria gruberi]|eukprot:XP_002673453.1 predicted protein [Naegleria gruberi strain NEG-M]
MSLQPFHNFTTVANTLTQDSSFAFNLNVTIVRHVKWISDSLLTFFVENTYASDCVKIYRTCPLQSGGMKNCELIESVKLVTDEDCAANVKTSIGWLEVASFPTTGSIYLMTVIKKVNGEEVKYVERIFKLQNIGSGSSLEQLCHSNELTVRMACSIIADEERECVYMIGGLNIRKDAELYRDDISQFNVKTIEWSLLTNVETVALYSHSSLMWKNKFIVIFGGYISSCSVSSNITLYNLETKQWLTAFHLLEDSPSKSKANGRTNSGIALLPNEWACKFNRSIPNNSECDTLIIYGGRISKLVSKRLVYVESSDILLFHLNESELKVRQRREEYSVEFPFELKHFILAMPKNEFSSLFVFGEETSKMSLIFCGCNNISKADLFSSPNVKKN